MLGDDVPVCQMIGTCMPGDTYLHDGDDGDLVVDERSEETVALDDSLEGETGLIEPA